MNFKKLFRTSQVQKFMAIVIAIWETEASWGVGTVWFPELLLEGLSAA